MKFHKHILLSFIFLTNHLSFATIPEDQKPEVIVRTQMKTWKDLYQIKSDEVLKRRIQSQRTPRVSKITAICNFERKKVEDLQHLGKAFSGIEFLKVEPDESMDSTTLANYLDFGSSRQKKRVVEILIARDEIDEYMSENLWKHPLNNLRPYDMAYTEMVLKLMDYAIPQQKITWILEGLRIIQEDLNLRLNQWFFSSDGYISLVAAQYFYYVSQLQHIGGPEFDIQAAGINEKLLLDKKWKKALRHNKGLSLQYSFLWDLSFKPHYSKDYVKRPSGPSTQSSYYAPIADIDESS